MSLKADGSAVKVRFLGRYAFITGMLALLVISAISKAVKVLGHLPPGENIPRQFVHLALLLTGVAIGWQILATSWQGPESIWRVGLSRFVATNAGIAVGVVVWVFVEELVFRHIGTGTYPMYEEHNLFPIEIIVWWVTGAIPLLLGIGLGILINRLRHRSEQAADHQ